MHKRLRHYEMHDDDSYEMLFTGYLSLDLYYVPTNPDIMHGYGEHELLHFKVFCHQGLRSTVSCLASSLKGKDFCLSDK